MFFFSFELEWSPLAKKQLKAHPSPKPFNRTTFKLRGFLMRIALKMANKLQYKGKNE